MNKKPPKRNKKRISLEQLIADLRSACNPTADDAADRLLAADEFFREIAHMAGSNNKQ